MATNFDIKKYVGVAGDAIANVWQNLRSQDSGPEASPPVGARDEFGPTRAAAVGGLSMTTILLLAGAYFLLRR